MKRTKEYNRKRRERYQLLRKLGCTRKQAIQGMDRGHAVYVRTIQKLLQGISPSKLFDV